MGLLALMPQIISTIGDALGYFGADRKAQAELLLKQIDAEQAQLQAQAGINQVEAASSSLFVAGWRPFIGWVCGAGFLFEFVLRPLLVWASPIWFPGMPVPPSLSDVLMELVCAMLGIGGLRTFEKVKKVTR